MLTFSHLMIFYNIEEIHWIKLWGGILSITIGINLWFVPQISEHCPKNKLDRLIKKFVWFNRPGVASIFTPKAGIVHEWRTSAAVTKIRICLLTGKIIRLSTSNRRNPFIESSFVGII